MSLDSRLLKVEQAVRIKTESYYPKIFIGEPGEGAVEARERYCQKYGPGGNPDMLVLIIRPGVESCPQ